MTLLIRADADQRMGTGHLMRCLALAQAWQAKGGEVIFITACGIPALHKTLLGEGFRVILLDHKNASQTDWKVTSEVLASHVNGWVVLDGYHFDEVYQRKIKEAGHKLLVIDDMAHLPHYYADLLLNQNMHARELLYVCEPYSLLLLGSQYTLLRREFWPWRDWQRPIPEKAKTVMVTLGGSDPDNQTLKVIQAIAEVEAEEIEAVIVVGPGNKHMEALEAKIRSQPMAARLERNPADMPAIMARADVAVSAGGSTAWELAYMGVPSLILVLADNQQPVAVQVDAAGAGINLGYFSARTATDISRSLADLIFSSRRRRSMSRRGRQMINGRGDSRVIQEMDAFGMSLRLAREEDCHFAWAWANDPVTRAASFSSEPITWDDHVKWFTARMLDTHTVFYIATDATGDRVGQVRYQVTGREAVLSVNIAPQHRGRGLGSMLVRTASEKLFGSNPVDLIKAYVKPENTASIHVFLKAGFADCSGVEVQGQMARCFTMKRELSI